MMKKLLLGLIVMTTLALTGCEKDDSYNLSKLEGEWALVGEYDDYFGFEYYYDESDAYINIKGNEIEIYETHDWGYLFKNGYYQCSRDDFYHVITLPFELRGGGGYFKDDYDDVYIELNRGKLYYYYVNDEDGLFLIFERIKSFTKD